MGRWNIVYRDYIGMVFPYSSLTASKGSYSSNLAVSGVGLRV